jgi:hypothetical protein
MDSTVMTRRSQIDSNYLIPLAAVERLGRAEAVKGSPYRFVITARVGTVTLQVRLGR